VRTSVRTARRPAVSTCVPFTLNFEGHCARFPFIFGEKPVTSIGNDPAPSCLISGREAGDMVFRLPNKNRDAFFRAQGIPAEKVYSLFQVHSRDVFTVPDVCAREGDGMVSFSYGVFPAVTVADCLPVFLLDTENGFFAVLHSGWKGTGIVIKALEIMRQAGSKPQAIAAVLGPCIQSCCYKVDEERARNFEKEFGLGSSQISSSGTDGYPLGNVIRTDDSGWYIGLQAANARLLATAGVQHIAYCTNCTFTDTRLGSFRREGAETYTRMIAMGGVNFPLPLPH